MADEIRRICAGLEAEDVSAVLIDAPQLFEAHLENCCDCVIAVVAPEDLRIERICQRDGISAERAQIRLEHQLDDLFLEGHADYIIMNDGLTDIDSQVNAILDDMGL